MEIFFGKKIGAKLPRSASDIERAFQRDLPLFMMEIVRDYFRLEVEGIENIPKRGRCLVVPNHSGVTALDAVMIGHEIYRDRKRMPRILAHPLWFIGPQIKFLVKRMGLEEADARTGIKLLKKGNTVILFPEGAEGNFKPTAERYHLQEFHRGFVRMAMATQAPIIPTVVIGAEETNINLSQISLTKYLKGVVIPVPLNVLPLPAKWKIVFMKPIPMDQYTVEDAADKKLVYKICNMVRKKIQTRINKELKNRDSIYFSKKLLSAPKKKKKRVRKSLKKKKS